MFVFVLKKIKRIKRKKLHTYNTKEWRRWNFNFMISGKFIHFVYCVWCRELSGEHCFLSCISLFATLLYENKKDLMRANGKNIRKIRKIIFCITWFFFYEVSWFWIFNGWVWVAFFAALFKLSIFVYVDYFVLHTCTI